MEPHTPTALKDGLNYPWPYLIGLPDDAINCHELAYEFTPELPEGYYVADPAEPYVEVYILSEGVDVPYGLLGRPYHIIGFFDEEVCKVRVKHFKVKITNFN